MATSPGGHRLGDNPRLNRGERVSIVATGFKAGEKVRVVLHSTARTLGTIKAGSNGKVQYAFRVPSNLSGQHRLVFTGAHRTRTFAFRVAGERDESAPLPAAVAAAANDPLAHTGAEVGKTVGLAFVLMLIGGGALLTVRPVVGARRRHR